MIVLDLSFYWLAVATILVALAGQWGFRRVRSLMATR